MAKRFQNPWAKGGQFGHILDKVLDTSQVLGKAPSFSGLNKVPENPASLELPQVVLDAMQAAINDSYVKGRGGDEHGGFHEEGGIWGYKPIPAGPPSSSSQERQIIVARGVPGAFADPSIPGKNAHYNFFKVENLDDYINEDDFLGFFHTHPSGFTLQLKSGGPLQFNSGRTVNTPVKSNPPSGYNVGTFTAEPSTDDLKLAKLYPKQIHLVVSTINSTIYHYNEYDIINKFPFSQFNLSK
jgi:hypothetical protein